MRWQQGRRSTNVDDRRGGGRRAAVGLPIGCGTLVLAFLFLALGGDPTVVLGLLDSGAVQAPPAQRTNDDPAAAFVSTILADTEDVWGSLFSRAGSRYPQPTLVLFEDRVRSACGAESASTGPFYCPADQTVYLDLSFFRQLARDLGAPGDFAAAYVVAHEVGHHVQNVTGTMNTVQQQKRANPTGANSLSVLVELQADCYAGVWAHHANAQRQLLESGDVEEGLRAAAAIGDDTLQGSRARPDTFTHGTSKQRVEWFARGLKSGDVASCDTFPW